MPVGACADTGPPEHIGTWALHIEDFTRARVNESDLTAVLVETGANQSRLNCKIQPLVVEGAHFTHS